MGHQRRNRIIRYCLLTIILMVVGSLYFFYSDNFSLFEVEEELKHQNEAIAPNFNAVDAQGNPYHVTAEKAYIEDNSEFVVLKSPFYEITLKNGQKVIITAERGRLNQTTKDLHLEGKVHVVDSRGYIFDSEEADVNFDKGLINGKKPLTGEGPDVTVQSGSFEIHDKGDKIILKERPTLTFQMKGSNKNEP
jgi:LPS export ABC transporter protein LptC